MTALRKEPLRRSCTACFAGRSEVSLGFREWFKQTTFQGRIKNDLGALKFRERVLKHRIEVPAELRRRQPTVNHL